MKKGFTLIELLIVLAIVGIIMIVLAPITGKFVGFHSTYSEGERTGVITKLSKKGFFCKTWEGEMNLGGMSSDSNGIAVPNIWKFSVSDEKIAKLGQQYATGANRVTIQYKEILKSSFCEGDTDYFIIGFKTE